MDARTLLGIVVCVVGLVGASCGAGTSTEETGSEPSDTQGNVEDGAEDPSGQSDAGIDTGTDTRGDETGDATDTAEDSGSDTGEKSSENGPPETENWTVAFSDDFDGDSLDENAWISRFGWGRNTSIGPVRAVDENVEVRDSKAVLEVTEAPDDPEADYHVGVIASKNRVTIEPPVYVEARVKTLDLQGSNTAFWSKPDSEQWPPEIDFFELPNGNVEVDQTTHHIHTASSGTCGDSETHEDTAVTGRHRASDHARNWHVFGLEWRSDRVVYYKNGNEIGRANDEKVMTSLSNCTPFYVMFTTMIPDWLSAPEDLSGTKTTYEIDWFRKWKIQ